MNDHVHSNLPQQQPLKHLFLIHVFQSAVSRKSFSTRARVAFGMRCATLAVANRWSASPVPILVNGRVALAALPANLMRVLVQSNDCRRQRRRLIAARAHNNLRSARHNVQRRMTDHRQTRVAPSCTQASSRHQRHGLAHDEGPRRPGQQQRRGHRQEAPHCAHAGQPVCSGRVHAEFCVSRRRHSPQPGPATWSGRQSWQRALRSASLRNAQGQRTPAKPTSWPRPSLAARHRRQPPQATRSPCSWPAAAPQSSPCLPNHGRVLHPQQRRRQRGHR